ncbi:phage terminase small subunit P27 family [Streptomyces sp. NPDC004111]|uniref:phage terminase small subunit P27 family n=1 Tax=Streptomyces sp. NPDC004111 TaxID=3364690 RepID=UPI0036A03BD5
MAVPGRKPKPYIAAVREGTFRPDRNKEGVRFPPVDPVEPRWADILPGPDPEVLRARKTAAELWGRLVPVLTYSAGLVDTQRETVTDYCVTWAWITMGNRALAREGVVIDGDRGKVRNPWCTVLSQQRQHFRSLTGELGLTPASAQRIAAPQPDDDDDDIFD